MAKSTERWVLGHRVTPVETGADFGMLTVVSPGHAEGPPPHHHEDAVELFLILRGRLEVMCDGTWRSLGEGDNFVVPRGSVHTFRNPDGVEARWLTTFAPRGFERFFTDFGIPTDRADAQAASVDGALIGEVIARCGEYGMILAKGSDRGGAQRGEAALILEK